VERSQRHHVSGGFCSGAPGAASARRFSLHPPVIAVLQGYVIALLPSSPRDVRQAGRRVIELAGDGVEQVAQLDQPPIGALLLGDDPSMRARSS
jgi:hypothetical protein